MGILVLNDAIEKMFKQIAASLKLGYQKTAAPGGDVYNFFNKDGFLMRFSMFVDRQGKINILVNFGSMDERPLSWGAYTTDELATKAKAIITAKTMELIKKK